MWLPGVVAMALVTGSGSDAGVAGRGGPKPQRESADSSRPQGELDIAGSMNDGFALPVLIASEAEIRRCRDRFATSGAGRCAVRFVVLEDGNVGTAAVIRSWLSPSLSAPEFVDCVVSALHALRFPRPGGASIVTCSYVLP